MWLSEDCLLIKEIFEHFSLRCALHVSFQRKEVPHCVIILKKEFHWSQKQYTVSWLHCSKPDTSSLYYMNSQQSRHGKQFPLNFLHSRNICNPWKTGTLVFQCTLLWRAQRWTADKEGEASTPCSNVFLVIYHNSGYGERYAVTILVCIGRISIHYTVSFLDRVYRINNIFYFYFAHYPLHPITAACRRRSWR